MPDPLLVALLGALSAASVAFWICRPLLRWLPEPLAELAEEEAERAAAEQARAAGAKVRLTRPQVAGEKIPYARLATISNATRSALLAMVAAGLVGWRLGWAPLYPAWWLLSVIGALLTVIDLRTHFLPTAIVGRAYVLIGLALIGASAVTGDWAALSRAAVCGVVTFVVFTVLWWIVPRGVGYGDVRLSGLLGLLLGWSGVAEAVVGVYGGFLCGAVIGGALSLLKVFNHKAYPYGPFMLLGAVAGVLVGPEVLRLSFG